ncbi:unnamed protein product [Soboliphyme baturini]|uniref:Uncharacterized protein n=1 Tax=Soboliphyme baturini TaxID=241478 RepID=A0A3P8EIH1_9BILA|nr:unnamed protein product [Soboliphyme baturini]
MKPPPLIVLSFDGFRVSYLQRGKTKNLDIIKRCGSSAEYMYPSYPSKTFPNHYTIATGLYPESHGIVDNKMYDPSHSDPKTRWFNQKTNIWNTAIKNGLKSATIYWFGSGVAVQGTSTTLVDNHVETNDFCTGMQPTYYSGKKSPESQIKQVVDWLLLPDSQRPSIIMAYFSIPDGAGHLYGPHAKEVNNQVSAVDGLIGQLMSSLLHHGLLHCVNVVILSDHGQFV